MLSLPIHEHSLPIFLDLWFLTAVCYIFQHISPIHTVLGSYLSISLFLNKCAIIFLLLVSDVFTVTMQKDNSFWMLVLCPANLLNSLIFQELLRRILGIFYVDNHVICKQSFISSFSNCVLFILFPLLTLLPWLGLPELCYKTLTADMLALLLTAGGKHSNSLSLNTDCKIFLIGALYQIEKISIPIFLRVFHEWVLNSVKCLFCINDIIISFLYFGRLIQWIIFVVF